MYQRYFATPTNSNSHRTRLLDSRFAFIFATELLGSDQLISLNIVSHSDYHIDVPCFGTTSVLVTLAILGNV